MLIWQTQVNQTSEETSVSPLRRTAYIYIALKYLSDHIDASVSIGTF